MAFTNKIRGVISNITRNLPGGIGGELQQFANQITGQAQNSKIAAKLLNKSPLEIEDNSPSSHMKENPFDFTQVAFPQEAGEMQNGHYIVFDILMHNESAFKMTSFDGTNIKKLKGKDKFSGDIGALSGIAENQAVFDLVQSGAQKRIRKPNSGLGKTFNKHTVLSNSIMLYTPASGLEFKYAAEYEAVPTGLLGLAAARIGDIGSFSDVMDAAGEVAGEGIKQLAGKIGDMVTGGAATAIQQQITGTAVNPMLEQTFKGVGFRQFNYNYTFMPKNKTEMDDMHKIIKLFKFHMLPESSTPDKMGARFIVPSKFQIMYMYREKENLYIPKVSRCVLTDMQVNYAPDGEVQTFKGDENGSSPVSTNVTLTFMETEIMTKETIAEGF